MSATMTAYASEVDAFAFGTYRSTGARRRPGPTEAVPLGRHHLYVSWASVRSHHVAILRSLLGLDDAVSVSYVDSLRDGRGWAFRPRTGPDPVNGFTLLRQAYEASRPDHDGEVRVPLLWDREARVIASDDPDTIVASLVAAAARRCVGVSLGRGPAVTVELARLERSFATDLDGAAALRDPVRRTRLRVALADLDRRLGGQRHLSGYSISDADVRLWVRLVRLDAGPNATGAIGPRLDRYPNLWRWATELYRRPAFRDNTDFARFAAPFAVLPPWPTGGL